MNDDELFPQIKKTINDFLYEEEGNITRNKVIAMGTMVLVLSLLMHDEVFADHRSHSSNRSHSSHRSHSSGSGGHYSHSSHESHSSHSSSSTHSSHGSHSSHSNHSNHASHSNTSHYSATDSAGFVSDTTITTKVSGIKAGDVSEILVPQTNASITVDTAVNTIVSIPPNTEE